MLCCCCCAANAAVVVVTHTSNCFVVFRWVRSLCSAAAALLCCALLRSLLTSARFVRSLQTACRVRHDAPFYKQRSLTAVAALLSQYSLSCSGCCELALSRALPLARALILIWCPALLVCLDCSRFGVFCFGIFVDIVSFVPKKTTVLPGCAWWFEWGWPPCACCQVPGCACVCAYVCVFVRLCRLTRLCVEKYS